MQLYGEVGGVMGARDFSWMRLDGESLLKNGSVVLRKGRTLVSVQMSSQRNSVWVQREREEGQPHTLRGVRTHLLAHLKHPMSHCWRSRCGGLLAWVFWGGDVGRMAPREALVKEGAGKRHLKQRINVSLCLQIWFEGVENCVCEFFCFF